MIVLAVDPGTVQSAWLVAETTAGVPAFAVCPGLFSIEPNDALIDRIRGWHDAARVGEVPFLDVIVVEQVASYGMPVGAEVFETVHWAGRFAEAAFPLPVYRIPRKTVCMALCGSTRAKDPNIRRALLDRFGGDAAIKRKPTPGPLYGIHGDLWAALGVAVTWADMLPAERQAARLDAEP